MKLLSIVGARPQFVKVAVVVDALRDSAFAGVDHRILHTGQHYDRQMSDSFFAQLGMPEPHFHLGIGSGSHGAQTGAMLTAIERALNDWRPDGVIIYGDTNSTLAGAIAAAKLHIPIAHLEAGLRSFNRRMPEEINRVVADQVSTLLLCPTRTAMENASREGLHSKSVLSGDLMLDSVLKHAPRADPHPLLCDRLRPRSYALVTLHRAENTDDPNRLKEFVTLLERIPMQVVLPMHPRLAAKITRSDSERLELMDHVHRLEPCDYFAMLALERDAALILTDSGGVQKEAYFLSVPCLTLRDETEWSETLAGNWNRILGLNAAEILAMVSSIVNGNGASPHGSPDLSQFGSGNAGHFTVEAIMRMNREKS